VADDGRGQRLLPLVIVGQSGGLVSRVVRASWSPNPVVDGPPVA
jgi:hypothetical protein